MSAPKPVPCPLLPGVEPKIDDAAGEWRVVAFTWGDTRDVHGPWRATEAEAITAWNEWMTRIEPAVMPIAIEDGHPVAPIAKLTVDGAGMVTSAHLYAPGLPEGEHDVYPVAVVKP